MAATATERRPMVPAMSNDMLQRVILSLSLSPASKVIVKRHGGCGGGGGATFRCKTCGRAFLTFQALGGHRTSHKRPLVRAHGLDLLLGARPEKGAAAAAASHVHRCTTCGAVFPTGQALGGHMRRHRAATAAALDVAMAVSAGETTARRVVDALSSGELVQSESEDDDARSVRLFKFI